MAQAEPLLPDEKIVWEGAPDTGLILRPIETFLIPFSLLWGGFALFWNIAVWRAPTDDISFKLFGLPFLVAGLYITVGRFAVDIAKRRSLRYRVTNQRILISSGRSTKSLDIKRLPSLELVERSDSSGTIRFGAASSLFAGNAFGIWQPSMDPTPQFVRIQDVRSVYQIIQRQAGA